MLLQPQEGNMDPGKMAEPNWWRRHLSFGQMEDNPDLPEPRYKVFVLGLCEELSIMAIASEQQQPLTHHQV